MNLSFPSREFDEALAAVCHGSASDAQMAALNHLLRTDPAARDEYIWQLELHSRLASDPDLFPALQEDSNSREALNFLPLPERREVGRAGLNWVVALAACFALLAAGWWWPRSSDSGERKGTISQAVAMLDRVVDAQWHPGGEAPRLGAPLEPGSLRLQAGLAQIVFYSGARVAIEGPTELRLISPSEASCPNGRLIAEIPPQTKGFRLNTPHLRATDRGASFGLEARGSRTELHVFKGSVEFQPDASSSQQTLKEGEGVVAESSSPLRRISSNHSGFATLFDLQTKSSAAEMLRHEQWRATSGRLDEDPSVLVHFDFEPGNSPEWRLPNTSRQKNAAPDASIVGCQWTEGRWPDKRALAFRGVSDRVCLTVPGEYESLTLAAWVSVQGLDRQINSLFMSDGFEAGTVHWSIRGDGVLGLTAIGSEPGHYQICASRPVLALDQFGLWVHLAVVIDGAAMRVTHYLNGTPVSENALTISPPFHIGAAQLGNWNTREFPKNDPFLIRNFSGAIDDFCLFQRPLNRGEIHELFSSGKPQPDSLRSSRP